MTELQHTHETHWAEQTRYLRSLARQLLRTDDVDDDVQDAVVTALSSPPPRTSPKAWIAQVLRNGVRGRARRSRRWGELERLVPEAAALPRPDESFEASEAARELREILDELDEPYRSVIRRRFFDERSLADIAREDDCPAGTARWRMHEGLKRIRQELDRRHGSRERWNRAWLVFAGLPTTTTTTTTGKTMITSTLITSSILITAIAAGGAAVYDSRSSDKPVAVAQTGFQPKLEAPPGTTAPAPVATPSLSDPEIATPVRSQRRTQGVTSPPTPAAQEPAPMGQEPAPMGQEPAAVDILATTPLLPPPASMAARPVIEESEESEEPEDEMPTVQLYATFEDFKTGRVTGTIEAQLMVRGLGSEGPKNTADRYYTLDLSRADARVAGRVFAFTVDGQTYLKPTASLPTRSARYGRVHRNGAKVAYNAEVCQGGPYVYGCFPVLNVLDTRTGRHKMIGKLRLKRALKSAPELRHRYLDERQKSSAVVLRRYALELLQQAPEALP